MKERAGDINREQMFLRENSLTLKNILNSLKAKMVITVIIFQIFLLHIQLLISTFLVRKQKIKEYVEMYRNVESYILESSFSKEVKILGKERIWVQFFKKKLALQLFFVCGMCMSGNWVVSKSCVIYIFFILFLSNKLFDIINFRIP